MLAGCYSIVSVCYNKMDELISAKRQVPAGNFLPISPKCTWMVQIWYQVLDLITKCQVYQGKKSTQLQKKKKGGSQKEGDTHFLKKIESGLLVFGEAAGKGLCYSKLELGDFILLYFQSFSLSFLFNFFLEILFSNNG